MKLIRSLSRGLIAAVMAAPVSAALIPGVGFLLDTETRLQWRRLDNEALLNLTWEQASTAVRGFRLATAGDLVTFYSHAGIVGEFGSGENPAVISLLHDWGIVVKTAWAEDSRFWIADEGFPGTHGHGALAQVYELEPGTGSAWLARPWDGWASEPTHFRSAALVREIPEPSTYSLMLVGMGLLWHGAAVNRRAPRRIQ